MTGAGVGWCGPGGRRSGNSWPGPFSVCGNDLAAQRAEAAGPGQGRAVGPGDDGGHLGGLGKGVLHGLDVVEIEEVGELHGPGVVRGPGQDLQVVPERVQVAFARGHVQTEGQEAAVVQARRGGQALEDRAVAAAEMEDRLGRAGLPEEPEMLHAAGLVRRGQEFLGRAAGEGPGLGPDQGQGRGIGLQDDALGVQEEDAHGRGLENRPATSPRWT
jgi:hypothetical protein